jgi:hypothetical protein
MRLDARGTPLHSRALTVVVSQRTEGGLAVEGTLLDVRKRGFVPVAGDLQAAGLIHHMRLLATVTAEADRLETIVADQPSVAFEPTATTGGESCRDPIRAVEALAGAPLDAELARRTSAALGGPRGCSHVLTLAHLLGATLLSIRSRLAAAPGGWRPGERIFRRDLAVDGSEPADGSVHLAAQLTDLAFAPAPPRARPMDRFAAAYELRALADVDFPGLAVRTIAVADRHRGPDTLDVATWTSRDDAVAGLAGLRLGGGATSALLARFGGDPDDRPLLDTLLMLAPALVQCAAALSDPWAALYRTNPSEIALGGLPDSCYMWRRGGALDRLRAGETPTPPGRGLR